MPEPVKPPSLRGLLRVLKNARDELLGDRLDNDWQGTLDELARAIGRTERYLKSHD